MTMAAMLSVLLVIVPVLHVQMAQLAHHVLIQQQTVLDRFVLALQVMSVFNYSNIFNFTNSKGIMTTAAMLSA
jgi:hypothetical protein